jgi:hypothetical protein
VDSIKGEVLRQQQLDQRRQLKEFDKLVSNSKEDIESSINKLVLPQVRTLSNQMKVVQETTRDYQDVKLSLQ